MSTNSDRSGGGAGPDSDGSFWIDLPLPAPGSRPAEGDAPTPEPDGGPAAPPASEAAFVAADPAGVSTETTRAEPAPAAPIADATAPDGTAPERVLEEDPVDEDSGGAAAIIPVVLGGALALAIAVGLEAAGLWSTLLPP